MINTINNTSVTVIIPLYNNKKYLKKCLDCLQSQTLKNIEIIIIDNNSTDGSANLVEKYISIDNRINIIHMKTNIGAGLARNYAMSKAKGDYIAFIDSDDFYPIKNSLEVLYKKAIENNANICGGSLYKVDKDNIRLDINIDKMVFTEEKLYKYEEYQYDGGFYRFIYKRSFLLENKLFFPNRKKFEDPIFFIKSMIKSKNFYAIPLWVYAYRIGHKQYIWNTEEIIDHLLGIQELLILSNENKLSYLHHLMVKNLLYTLSKRIKKLNLIDKIYIILKIYKNINWNLIKNENKINKEKITIIKFLMICFYKKNSKNK